MSNLTKGGVNKTFRGDKPRHPVLQVTMLTVVAARDGQAPPRIKCRLSDGKQWGMAALTGELAQMAIMEKLKETGCIRLENYVVGKLSHAKILIVVDAEVMSQEEAPVGAPEEWTHRVTNDDDDDDDDMPALLDDNDDSNDDDDSDDDDDSPVLPTPPASPPTESEIEIVVATTPPLAKQMPPRPEEPSAAAEERQAEVAAAIKSQGFGTMLIAFMLPSPHVAAGAGIGAIVSGCIAAGAAAGASSGVGVAAVLGAIAGECSTGADFSVSSLRPAHT